MAYRRFVPTSTPATVATTATVQGRAPQCERHTHCDNRDSCDTSNLIRPKCRKVATVAGDDPEFNEDRLPTVATVAGGDPEFDAGGLQTVAKSQLSQVVNPEWDEEDWQVA